MTEFDDLSPAARDIVGKVIRRRAEREHPGDPGAETRLFDDLFGERARVLGSLSSYGLSPDLLEGVDGILAGAKRVGVFGDYDVDGMTSVTIAREMLSGMYDAAVDVEIPTRAEGYGLQPDAVADPKHRLHAWMADKDVIITVDNGIASRDAVRALKDAEKKVIVTDHHEPAHDASGAARLPEADIVYNLMLISRDPGMRLCGAATIWQLLRGVSELRRRKGARCVDPEGWLDLVALATLADSMPLVGQNRCLVSAGLDALRRTGRRGPALLAERMGRHLPALSASNVQFYLVPPLNAAGRLGDPGPALSLIMGRGDLEATASFLCEGNIRRRTLQARLADRLMPLVGAGAQILAVDDPSLPPAPKELLNPGLYGLVAGDISRICGGVPVLVGAFREDGRLRGSARAGAGWNLVDLMRRASVDGGGHAQAAGFAALPDALERFRQEAANVSIPVVGDAEAFDIDLPVTALTEGLAGEIASVGPFGAGNEPFVFRVRGRIGRTLKERGDDAPEVVGRRKRAYRSSPSWMPALTSSSWTTSAVPAR